MKRNRSEALSLEDSSSSDSSSAEGKGKSRKVHPKKKSRKLKQTSHREHQKKEGDSSQLSTTTEDDNQDLSVTETKKPKEKEKEPGTKIGYTKIDNVYDKKSYCFVLRPSSDKSEADGFRRYALIVRREFSYNNEYEETHLEIVSKPLKASLERIMGEVQSVSLKEDTPSIDPKIAFLFLDDIRTEMGSLKAQSKSQKGKQKRQQATLQAKHLEVLVRYFEQEYKVTMKTLYPLLDDGKITFDLVWALFKSNEPIYAPTYGVKEESWIFQLEHAHKDTDPQTKAESYKIEGRYLEYDGTNFGTAKITFTIPRFKGPRKISSLECFPFKYHPEYTKLKPDVIERGKKFVTLKGIKYRYLQGRAFQKSKNQTKRYFIKGRIMIDPATFRRFNPDYKALDVERGTLINEPQLQPDTGSDGASTEDDQSGKEDEKKDKGKTMNIEEIFDEDKLTDEQYLIASPVVYGYSLSEKIWIEMTVSGIRDIEFDMDAFASLEIPSDQKQRLKALIELHSGEVDEGSGDIIKGKGGGLIVLLHGPPGTGKTLTAESVSDRLKKPLYNVTMGELMGKEEKLKKNLAATFDLARTWRAVLLLDEAEVFLQQRKPYNTAYNVIVSILLNRLEYFQGVLILATNFARTFDAAALSRIHISIKFDHLQFTARAALWRLFINKARALPDCKIANITEDDYKELSGYELNGREIKNIFHTARALAQLEKQVLSIGRLLEAIRSAKSAFNETMGPGYEESLKLFM